MGENIEAACRRSFGLIHLAV
ncbi:hypothetical protein CGLO_17153 [Colletotrichum gloeosporioides Cg-14]|uniref:Uncharacterized protein n=1 Tax=Colletotrichum gloeosporioides (strain Cg-14) TaxID=1237896 RepID=T0JU92_COLGC|nr:hypothetical protein CGLO_17153 [Colletotrichum gloeosporioides Cg-14]